MFTGLIQAVGEVSNCERSRLSVAYLEGAWSEPFAIGESVAVNGCCLTVIANEDSRLDFELSEETRRRTSLGELGAGPLVNLERAMRPIDRFGGHIVQGHVDGIGKIIEIQPGEGGTRFRFTVPNEGEKYLIDKGSIALDGVSLTVVDPMRNTFDVWMIPHTLASTSFRSRLVGDSVNVEFDVLAKHVEKLLGR